MRCHGAQAFYRRALVACVLIACGQPRHTATSDAGSDAANTSSPFVGGGPFVPSIVRFVGEPVASFASCMHDGKPVTYGARVLVDDCVECQCTTYGLRCRKRTSCPDDRCVFVDGQVVARGDSAIVETCFDCVCGAGGPACTRRTEAPCPVDGCMLANTVLPIGSQRFVSECHACDCDASMGLWCRDVCSEGCLCDEASPNAVCAMLCDEFSCPIVIPDQDRVELACGTAVCDYSELVKTGCP